jgi:ketosteroid isomerase-like protein
MANPTPIELLSRLCKAIEAGDIEGVRTVYSPDVIVWGNFDGQERGLDDAIKVLDWLISSTTARRYEIVRRMPLESGALQQHVLHGTTTNGKDFAMPACLIVAVDGAHITRIDEYLDPAPITAAME